MYPQAHGRGSKNSTTAAQGRIYRHVHNHTPRKQTRKQLFSGRGEGSFEKSSLVGEADVEATTCKSIEMKVLIANVVAPIVPSQRKACLNSNSDVSVPSERSSTCTPHSSLRKQVRSLCIKQLLAIRNQLSSTHCETCEGAWLQTVNLCVRPMTHAAALVPPKAVCALFVWFVSCVRVCAARQFVVNLSLLLSFAVGRSRFTRLGVVQNSHVLHSVWSHSTARCNAHSRDRKSTRLNSSHT